MKEYLVTGQVYVHVYKYVHAESKEQAIDIVGRMIQDASGDYPQSETGGLDAEEQPNSEE